MDTNLKIFCGMPSSSNTRQQALGTVLGKLQIDDPSESLGVTNLRGFSASAVDLGWLGDKIRAFASFSPMPIKTLCGLVEGELRKVIQRVKSLLVEPDKARPDRAVSVDMLTKDDFGYYRYQFSVVVSRSDN